MLTIPLLLMCATVTSPAILDATQSHTSIIVVPGFASDGHDKSGVFGTDDNDEVVHRMAELSGLPTSDDDPLAPNQIAMLRYYGDTPPDYYTQRDLDDLAAVQEQYDGGIPRYALIVAKYMRHVQDRGGAQRLTLVGISMGGLVSRWLIEHDLEGLASDGTIERWITIEGVVRGNYIASQSNLRYLLEAVGPDSIDITHMSYDWLDDNLPAVSHRAQLRHPVYRSILIGHLASTDDSPYSRALTLTTGANGDPYPNDGLQLVRDTSLGSPHREAMYRARPPMMLYSHNTHWSLADDDGGYVAVMGLVVGTRRVSVRMTQAEIFKTHESGFFEDDSRSEVVFEAEVYSPLAQARAGIERPISSLVVDGGVAHYEEMRKDRPLDTDYVILDATLLPNETQLRLRLRAVEIDRSTFYGNPDPLSPDPTQAFARIEQVVSATQSATYALQGDDWRCDLEVDVYDYAGSPYLFEVSRDWQRPSRHALLAGQPLGATGLVPILEARP